MSDHSKCSHETASEASYCEEAAALREALAEARAEVERLTLARAQLSETIHMEHQGKTLAQSRVEAAESQRDRAVQAAERLLDCIEVLAERAAEVGWLDRDQRVEGEITAARELLKDGP